MLGNFYSTFSVDTRLTGAEVYGEFADAESNPRQVALLTPGQTLGTVLTVYFRPLTLVNPLYIFRFLVFLVAVTIIFYSGFRNVLFSLLAWMLLSSYYQRGWQEVFRMCAILVPGLLFLGFLQGTVIDLPMPAQRALTFLPGNWSEAARADASASTKWRVDMWKDAIFTDKYIEDKIFGDGFGVSYAQMNRILAMQSTLLTNAEQGQESTAILGNFHSGPVSTIRFTGYIGLFLFLALMIQAMRVGHRILLRARNTPFQTLALFTCIPIVFRPVFFTFVFGGLVDDFPTTVIAIGMLKMLSNSLDAFESAGGEKEAAPSGFRPARAGQTLRPVRPLPAPITV